MKVALTVWENRISPLFDSTRMLIIANIKNRSVTDKHYEPFNYDSPFTRAAKLSDLGVKLLICGAISDFFSNLIETYGIRTTPFVAGAVNEVLDAYLTGDLSSSKYRMPGCGTMPDRDFRMEK
ncbi:MAG: hypothetical protein JRH09_17660 [Deltaproteobacteria bacterium]|nr:hypothetical protein [Deltaproteobacteria bacterium]